MAIFKTLASLAFKVIKHGMLHPAMSCRSSASSMASAVLGLVAGMTAGQACWAARVRASREESVPVSMVWTATSPATR